MDYIEKKEEQYFDKVAIIEEYLIKLALNKYALCKQKKLWGALSDEQEQVTSLSFELFELDKFKKDTKKSDKSGKSCNINSICNNSFENKRQSKKTVDQEKGV